MRNFLWGTTPLKRKIHLVNWKQITTPRLLGGLGIQRLELKNNALLAGLSWRLFHSPNQLWAHTLLQKYKNNPKKRGFSNTWKNIMLSWMHCQHGIQWQIGSNSNIRFWTDTWLAPNTTIRSLIAGPMPSNHLSRTIAT